MKKSYSYAELKGKLKVGMKVSADPKRLNICGELNDNGSNEVEITEITYNGFYLNTCFHYFGEIGYLMVGLEEPKTLQDLKTGDYIENEEGKRKILFRDNDVFCVSDYDTSPYKDWDKTVSAWLTIFELEKFGYKPVTEMLRSYSGKDEVTNVKIVSVDEQQPIKTCGYCNNKICSSGKKLTVEEWNKCPWHNADWNSTTKWIFIPRFIKEWWYFRDLH